MEHRSTPRGWLVVGAGLAAATSAYAARASDLDLSGPSETLQPEAPETVPAVEARGEPTYPLEFGGRVGYATAPIRGGVNPFGAGFGARIGYVVANVYLGATAAYYLGGSDVGASDQAMLVAAELGYGLRLGELVILRPMVGVGDAAVSHNEPVPPGAVDVVTTASGSSSTRTSITTTVHHVYVAPGLTMMLAYGAHFLAVRAEALVVPSITYGPSPAQSTTWISYSLEGQIGFRF